MILAFLRWYLYNIWLLMNQSERIERGELISRLKDQGLTQVEIAAKLGITRQRVQQLERFFGLSPRRIVGVRKEYNFLCKQCSKKFTTLFKGRQYCSRDCFSKSRRKYRSAAERKVMLEKRRLQAIERSRLYYHKVFKKRKDWKDIVRMRNQRYTQVHLT